VFFFTHSSFRNSPLSSCVKHMLLKGQCHEVFDLWFFHQTIPPGALIHGLKHFCIWLRIREVIRQSRCLSGVIDTAGAAPAVSLIPLVPPQRIQLRKLGLKSYRASGVNDTAGAAPAVSLTPIKPHQRCQ
jgi:hypothetical protein